MYNTNSYKRKLIKSGSWRALMGNWFRATLLILSSELLALLASRFMPVFSTRLQAFLSSENLVQLLQTTAKDEPWRLVAMLLPASVTQRELLLLLISALIFLLLIPPFLIGMRRFFSGVSHGEKPKLSSAFSVFANLRELGGAIALYLEVWLLMLLWSALICAAPIALLAYAVSVKSALLWELGTYLLLFALLFLICLRGIYEPAFYLFAQGNPESALAALRASSKLTRGNRRACMTFRASFFGWDIAVSVLSMFFFPLSLVYQPFYMTAYAAFTDQLSGKDSAEVSEDAPPVQ